MNTEDERCFVGADEGRALANPIGGRMVVKLRDGDTGGAYSVYDNTIPPGRAQSPPTPQP